MSDNGWKKARELVPGDECFGPAVFVDHGTVINTVALGDDDDTFQINYQGGMHVKRPGDFDMRVK